ncbi:phosphonate ABC transporter ATP-binding protein [Dendrosporobacter sp. 1207_IL3150]|uniref:phosphonate ABC transporter ATP-binding protein n=1 Tax=Dendrosporobacter sp. 1207_IL3150 TaxID=3084054 RepID=UPI002FD90602
MEIISAKKVSKIYSNGQGLKSVDFTISKGEFVGIVGESGAGKTTLMRLLCGAIFPTDGELIIYDTDMTNIRRARLTNLRRKISVVYQNYNVIPCLDVARNVMLGRLSEVSWLETIRRLFFLNREELGEIKSILEKLNIADKLNERCQELSGGQQQRVAIARALYSKADLFIADEPIASVDPATANLIINAFKDLKYQGKTIIMNLHQLDHAIKHCDRILMFEQGEICFDGKPTEFAQSSAYSRLDDKDLQMGVTNE